jgi:hypothetical protein
VIHINKVEIEDHQVGATAPGGGNYLAQLGNLRDHVDVTLSAQQRRERTPQQSSVVRE